ncbi:MAG: FUN14 domain-containing protein [Phycisphaerales bacterium]
MSDPDPKSPSAPPGRGLPAWAKVLVVIAVVLMAAGVAIPLVAGGASDAAPRGGAAGGGDFSGVTGLSAGGADGGGEPASAPPSGAASWGPAVFRLGFSAFVGFAIGYALRSFVKLALVALGFFFLALFGLQYAGLIEVRWAAMSERYDELSRSIGSGAKGAWSSMSILLPSAASATAGLVAGFWRRG